MSDQAVLREAAEAVRAILNEHDRNPSIDEEAMLVAAVHRYAQRQVAAKLREMADRLACDSRPGTNEGVPDWLRAEAAKVEGGGA